LHKNTPLVSKGFIWEFSITYARLFNYLILLKYHLILKVSLVYGQNNVTILWTLLLKILVKSFKIVSI